MSAADIQPYRPLTPDRRTVRAVAEVQSQALTQRAVDRARADLARERVRDVKVVAHEALLAVSEISAVEMFYADQHPHASGRLALIANGATSVLAGIVSDLGRP